MIDGTPVLDIKPYIPEYDSPITRKSFEICNSNAEQTYNIPASLDDNINVTDQQEDLKGDATDPINQKHSDTLMEICCPRKTSEAEISVTESSHPLSHLHSLLKDVKAFVAHYDFGVEEKVSASPETKPVQLGLVPPHYGEEAYSTIAGWVREPPVSSLEVRFTPHAEKELAQFLPTDPLCKINSHTHRYTHKQKISKCVHKQ